MSADKSTGSFDHSIIRSADASVSVDAASTSKSSRKRRSRRRWDHYPLPNEVAVKIEDLDSEVIAADPIRLLPKQFLESLSTTRLEPNHTIQMFHDNGRRLFRVHSACMEITVGLLASILEYNAVGPTRATRKLTVCPKYQPVLELFFARCKPDTVQATLEHLPLDASKLTAPGQVCDLGVHCPYVHIATVKDAEGHLEFAPGQLRHNYVHWRSEFGSMQPGYERYSVGKPVCVAEPNCHSHVSNIDSGRVLITQGVTEFFTQQTTVGESSWDNPTGGPGFNSEKKEGEKELTQLQHCAHFRKHGMCTLGPTCKFVHANVPPESVEDSVPDSSPETSLYSAAEVASRMFASNPIPVNKEASPNRRNNNAQKRNGDDVADSSVHSTSSIQQMMEREQKQYRTSPQNVGHPGTPPGAQFVLAPPPQQFPPGVQYMQPQFMHQQMFHQQPTYMTQGMPQQQSVTYVTGPGQPLPPGFVYANQPQQVQYIHHPPQQQQQQFYTQGGQQVVFLPAQQYQPHGMNQR